MTAREGIYAVSENVRARRELTDVACVPVGVTRYREGLYPLETFNKDTARARRSRFWSGGGDKFKGRARLENRVPER